ncbi:BglG family transcription antiterminator [Amphibacillus sp. Q70]|uniref:BglG family transcription antiterminator n=1 Tax=Amphibacillus sp. Q70 TaxID=3453416 RepID=UPI003F8479E8
METLNDRQKHILAFLADVNGPVTAKALADTFKVSLRTIRYDTEEIKLWLKDYDLELIKKPKVGVVVLNKTKLKEILYKFELRPAEVYSLEERKKIILLMILFSRGNVFSYDMADRLNISKTTVINTIKNLRDELDNFGITIEGKTRVGYFISGNEVLIRKYILYELFPILRKKCQNVFRFLNMFIDSEVMKDVHWIEKKISKNINYNQSVEKIQFLRFFILMLVSRINTGKLIEEKPHYHIFCYKSEIFKNIQSIMNEVFDGGKSEFIYNEIIYFIHFLLKENYDETVLLYVEVNEEEINEIVSQLIEYAGSYVVLHDTDMLRRELRAHFIRSFSRLKFGMNDHNPILDEIKTKYGDIYYIIEDTKKTIFQAYHINISEDEIGFITLYFVKAIERPIIKNKKILLVSNLRKSTTSFLKTRLLNNLTDVEIVDIKPAVDKTLDEAQIEKVDLIISTYNIEEVGKPTLIVSPMITSQELGQIRELLYLRNPVENRKKIELDDFKHSLSKILNKNNPIAKDSRMNIEIMNFFSFYSERYFNNMDFLDQEVEMISMILLEVLEMVTKLVDVNHQKSNYLKAVTGIFIHIVMAVPRWQRGEFIYENNYDYYKYKYPEEIKIIEETLTKINSKYNLNIKNTEAVSILSYTLNHN